MSIRTIEQGKRYLVEIDRAGIPRKRKSFKSYEQAKAFEQDYLMSHLIKMPNGLSDVLQYWEGCHAAELPPEKRQVIKTMLHLSTFI